MDNKKVTLEELMDIDANNLAQMQLHHYKKFVIGRLEQVISHIEKDEYREVKEMTIHSYGGDYGNENDFIDFCLNEKREVDILEATERLENLKKQSEVGKSIQLDSFI